MGHGAPSGPFRGLEGVYDTVEHMYSGCNRGKVVVEIIMETSRGQAVTSSRIFLKDVYPYHVSLCTF